LTYPTQPDLRWANCRGKALMHRLLSLTAQEIGSQAVRITLVILLGCVISHIGLRHSSNKLNAARLYGLLKNCEYFSCVMPDEMELWVLATGYTVSTAGPTSKRGLNSSLLAARRCSRPMSWNVRCGGTYSWTSIGQA